MPNFTIINWLGDEVATVEASGNIAALCIFAGHEPTMFPDFTMHAFEGILLANLDDSIYGVFDSEDRPDFSFMQVAEKKEVTEPQPKKLISSVRRLFSERPLNQIVEPAYVV